MLIEVKKGYTEVRFINRCGINDEALLAEFYQTDDKVTLINEEFLKHSSTRYRYRYL